MANGNHHLERSAADPLPLPRPELLQAIVGARSARLVLVRAAAGFGKTTLLQQYARHAIGEGRDVAWQSMTARDNDIDRFVAHFQEAWRDRTRPDAMPAAHHNGKEAGAGTSEGGDLVGLVTGYTRPFAVVFDEFEVIEDPAVLSWVQQLLDALPAHGVLLLATRRGHGLGVGRIRARGQLVEIGHGLLRFSLDEMRVYLRERRGLALGDAELEALHQRTEGWPAAIYLASLSCMQTQDAAAAVAGFTGTNVELAEFLAEDILAREEPAVQQFLLRSSVLEPFSAALCDAVLGTAPAQAMIDLLERRNLFIARADAAGAEYQYGTLFGSFLRGQLDRLEPGRAWQLSRAAAAWYVDAARPVRAVEQLLAANCLDEAVDAMAHCATLLQESGRTRLLVRWFDKLPADAVAREPSLAKSLAWALMFNRRHDDALRLLDAALAPPAAKGAPLALEADTLRCVVRAMRGQMQQACDEGLPLWDRLPEDAAYARGALANALAFAMVALDRYDDARKMLGQGVAKGSQKAADIMRPIGLVIETTIDLAQGRLGDAVARLEAGRAAHPMVTPRAAAQHGRPTTDVLHALALYEQDRLAECERALAVAMPFAKTYVSDDALVIAHLLAARLAWSAGERGSCLRVLAELEQLGRRSGAARVVCSAWLERSRLAILEGRLDTAEETLRAAELDAGWSLTGATFHGSDVETPFVARVRLRIARGDTDGLGEELQAAIDAAQSCSRHRRALTLRLLQAMALHRGGQSALAVDALSAVLRDAAGEGYLRLLLDEGPAFVALYRAWEPGQSRLRWSAGERRFLDALEASLLHPTSPQAGAGDATQEEPLSGREHQVLELLATGLRNKAIADRLQLSEFTVKSHLRNIHAKLGAGARTEAVAIARSRGLIP